MVTFEEQFPSLKKIANVKGITFTKECLMKTCLDKQRVRDVIDNLKIVGIMRTKGRLISVEDLKMWLGLKEV